jgi:hypothetical protein
MRQSGLGRTKRSSVTPAFSYPEDSGLKPLMPVDPKFDRAQRRRMRSAERKLKEAQKRLVRAERSVVYWSRMLADLKYERTRAIQPPLWPEEEIEMEK